MRTTTRLLSLILGSSRRHYCIALLACLALPAANAAAVSILIDDFDDSVGGDLSTVRTVLTSGGAIGPMTGQFDFVAVTAAPTMFMTLRYDPLANLDLTAVADDMLQIGVAQLVKISAVTLAVVAVDGVTSTTITPVDVPSGAITIAILSLTPWLVQPGVPLLRSVSAARAQGPGSALQTPLEGDLPAMSAVSLGCSPSAKPAALGVRRQRSRTSERSDTRPSTDR